MACKRHLHVFYVCGDHFFGDDGDRNNNGPPPVSTGFTHQAEIFAGDYQPPLPTEK